MRFVTYKVSQNFHALATGCVLVLQVIIAILSFILWCCSVFIVVSWLTFIQNSYYVDFLDGANVGGAVGFSLAGGKHITSICYCWESLKMVFSILKDFKWLGKTSIPEFCPLNWYNLYFIGCIQNAVIWKKPEKWIIKRQYLKFEQRIHWIFEVISLRMNVWGTYNLHQILFVLSLLFNRFQLNFWSIIIRPFFFQSNCRKYWNRCRQSGGIYSGKNRIELFGAANTNEALKKKTARWGSMKNVPSKTKTPYII